MEKELKLCLRQDVINGFSYSFTQCLLEKLKTLLKDKRIFKKEEYEKSDQGELCLTKLAEAIISHLQYQLFGTSEGKSKIDPKDLEDLIRAIEEFLEAFSLQYRGRVVLGGSIEEAEISPRSKRRLLHAGIKSIGELVFWSEKELLEIKGFGNTCLREIKRTLKDYELYLRDDPAGPRNP